MCSQICGPARRSVQLLMQQAHIACQLLHPAETWQVCGQVSHQLIRVHTAGHDAIMVWIRQHGSEALVDDSPVGRISKEAIGLDHQVLGPCLDTEADQSQTKFKGVCSRQSVTRCRQGAGKLKQCLPPGLNVMGI